MLAASVYCTAWTFYGSVGLAANRGLEFLTIYLGPACVALLWPVLLRKLVRVCKEQRITSMSDFISSRYGKSAPLGTLVAVLVVGGMIPYIALQLSAVSASFKMILRQESVLDVFDPTLLVAVTLALFGILFGARNLDFTKHQTGLMTAVAVESVVKLVAFLIMGVYVTWGLFDGFADLFGRVAARPEWSGAAHARRAPDRLVRPMDRDAASSRCGRHVPAAAVPRAGRPEPARARRERGVLVVSALPPAHQPVRAADRVRRAAGLPRAPAPDADGFILRLPLGSTARLIRSWCSSAASRRPPR